MSNKRKVIRQAFVDFLKMKTPAQNRVFSSRIKSISEDELPCMIIRDENEEADVFNQAGRIYKRELTIMVEVYCKARSNVDDQVNLFMEGVEAVIDQQDRFPPLDQVVHEIHYIGSGISLEGADKTQLTAVGTIRYRVAYFTVAGAMATDAPEYNAIFADFITGDMTTEFNIEQ